MPSPFADSTPSAEDIAAALPDLAYEVHRQIGGGWPAAVYRAALAEECRLKGYPVEQTKSVPVAYKGQEVGQVVLDLLIGGQVLVQVFSGKEPAQEDQVAALSTLRASKARFGFIAYFSATKAETKKLIASPI